MYNGCCSVVVIVHMYNGCCSVVVVVVVVHMYNGCCGVVVVVVVVHMYKGCQLWVLNGKNTLVVHYCQPFSKVSFFLFESMNFQNYHHISLN